MTVGFEMVKRIVSVGVKSSSPAPNRNRIHEF
jgi:hypothetical protein